MAANATRPPRSIMRRINGTPPSTPSRQREVESNISYPLSLDSPILRHAVHSSPPPSTPCRSVRFSPHPNRVFATYSAEEYERGEDDEPALRLPRSGHLDTSDLTRFRRNLEQEAQEPIFTTSANQRRAGIGSRFILEDAVDDESDFETDADSDEKSWGGGPARFVRPIHRIPRLQFDAAGSDSEDEGPSPSNNEEPMLPSVDLDATAVPIYENTSIISLVSGMSALSVSLPTPITVESAPAPEARSSQFEDIVGYDYAQTQIDAVLMPISTPKSSLRSSAFGAGYMTPSFSMSPTTTPSLMSLSSAQRTPTSSESSPSLRFPHILPSTPTRSRLHSSRSPSVLTTRDNFPRSLTSAESPRPRLLESRQKFSGLGPIDENEEVRKDEKRQDELATTTRGSVYERMKASRQTAWNFMPSTSDVF